MALGSVGQQNLTRSLPFNAKMLEEDHGSKQFPDPASFPSIACCQSPAQLERNVPDADPRDLNFLSTLCHLGDIEGLRRGEPRAERK